MASGNDKQRIQSFDVLKGFIIIAIVFVHLFFLSYSEGEARSDAQPVIIQLLYTGLMVFFLISGYFFRPDRGFVHNTRKRVTLLGAVFVIANVLFPLILFVELNLTGQGATLEGVLDSYWNLVGGAHVFESIDNGAADAYYSTVAVNCGHYFIEVMLIAFIVFYAIADRVMKDTRVAVGTVVALVLVQALYTEFVNYHLPWFAELAPIATAFMLLGAIFGKFRVVETFEATGYKDRRYWIAFVALLVVGVVLGFLFPPGILFDMSEFGAYGGWSAFPYFIMSACLCCAFVYIAWLVTHVPVLSDALRFAGKHTLALLIMHCFVIRLITAPFHTIPDHSYWFPEMGTVEIIIVGLVTVVVISLLAEYGPALIRKVLGKRSE